MNLLKGETENVSVGVILGAILAIDMHKLCTNSLDDVKMGEYP